eukprot:1141304-Pelagomonas_calceolata.AAC.2
MQAQGAPQSKTLRSHVSYEFRTGYELSASDADTGCTTERNIQANTAAHRTRLTVLQKVASTLQGTMQRLQDNRLTGSQGAISQSA